MKAIVTLSLILAFVLTAVGCMVNPVTGKNELSLISPAQEVELGRQAAPDVEKQMGGVYYNAALTRYVDGVGQRIATVSDRHDVPWTFKIVNTNEVNAFALPGGFIYVTKGLLLKMDNEAQLANVLGHEATHVCARHSVKALQNQLGMTILLEAIGAASGTNADTVKALGSVVANLVLLKYSRDYEYEADKYGVQYAAKANYNPQGMVQVFEIFKTLGSSSASAGEIFMSHPDTEKRIVQVQEIINTKYPTALKDPKMKFNENEYKVAMRGLGPGVNNPPGGAVVAAGISEEEEIKIGRQIMPQVEKNAGGLYNNQKVTQYVTNVGTALAKGGERPNLPWTFKVVNSDKADAFALPGGFVYVTKGLLRQMSSEAQLAAVLGHEIAHVNHKDTLNKLQESEGIEGLHSVSGAVSGRPNPRAIDKVASAMGAVEYDKDADFAADEAAMRYAVKAGYNPQGMKQALAVLAAQAKVSAGNEGEPSEILTSSDDISKRTDKVNALLKNEYKKSAADSKLKYNIQEYKAAVAGIN